MQRRAQRLQHDRLADRGMDPAAGNLLTDFFRDIGRQRDDARRPRERELPNRCTVAMPSMSGTCRSIRITSKTSACHFRWRSGRPLNGRPTSKTTQKCAPMSRLIGSSPTSSTASDVSRPMVSIGDATLFARARGVRRMCCRTPGVLSTTIAAHESRQWRRDRKPEAGSAEAARNAVISLQMKSPKIRACMAGAMPIPLSAMATWSMPMHRRLLKSRFGHGITSFGET